MRLHNVASRTPELVWLPYVVIGGSSFLLTILAFLLPPMGRDSVLLVATISTAGLWAREHWRARHRIARLVEQIGRGKFEIDGDPALATLHQALNTLTQQRRLKEARRHNADPQMIAALAVSIHGAAGHPVQARQQVEELANYLHNIAQRYGAIVQIQGSDLFVLLFGLDHPMPLATSSAEAVRAARRIYTALPHVRFGLSCGLGSCWLSPWGEHVLAPALEDAHRLVRMAQTWSEYSLLCPEPLARLLTRTNELNRTPLELTNPMSLPLRIFSLELQRSDIPQPCPV